MTETNRNYKNVLFDSIYLFVFVFCLSCCFSLFFRFPPIFLLICSCFSVSFSRANKTRKIKKKTNCRSGNNFMLVCAYRKRCTVSSFSLPFEYTPAKHTPMFNQNYCYEWIRIRKMLRCFTMFKHAQPSYRRKTLISSAAFRRPAKVARARLGQRLLLRQKEFEFKMGGKFWQGS